jgi:hypothetical protein
MLSPRQPGVPRADLAARFEPLRRAPRPARRLGLLSGSALWLVALIALAVVIRRLDVVGVALAVVAVSIVLGAMASAWMWRARLREEREG